VEVEVPAKLLVGSLSREHHLDTQSLDLPGKDKHGCTGADRGHVVSLKMVDNILNAVDALLHSEVELVVLGPELLGDLASVAEIGGALF